MAEIAYVDYVERLLAEFRLPIIRQSLEEVTETVRKLKSRSTSLPNAARGGSLMITSNLPFSKCDRIFHGPMTAMAGIDRLVHHSVILEFTGESSRMPAGKTDINLFFLLKYTTNHHARISFSRLWGIIIVF